MRFRRVGSQLTTGALAVVLGLLTAIPLIADQSSESPVSNLVGTSTSSRAADRVIAAVDSAPLQAFLREVLERNPELARLRAKAAAAAVRAPQVRSLPDPVAMVTAYALPPETRVGPQRLMVSLSQRFPAFGTLAAREKAAVFTAVEAVQVWESRRLAVVTEARELANEWAFSELQARIAEEERHHLVHHEELARARYASGIGVQQEVIKSQAAITRAEQRLLAVETQQVDLLAELNLLRDRFADTPFESGDLPEPRALSLEREALASASRDQPERSAAAAEVGRREALVELARRNFRPELRLGFDYTLVDRRGDRVGRTTPPQGNGNDVLAVSAGIEVPVHRARRAAALEEALAELSAAEAREVAVEARIGRTLGKSCARLPLLFEQWSLFETVLLPQAEEALQSAEIAYSTGKVNALELFHSEHVLYEVRLGAARARTDFAIAWARLEGALGVPWKGEEVDHE